LLKPYNMSVEFFSAVLKKDKPYEAQPPEGFVLNITNAAAISSGKEAIVLKVVTTGLEGEKVEAVLGTLRPGTVDQFQLNLVFGFDVPSKFFITGNGEVHLSGYYQPGPQDDDDMEGYPDMDEEDDEDEDEDDEEEPEEESKAVAAIGKLGTGRVVKKPESGSDEDEEDDEEDSEADSEDDEVDEAFVQAMIKKHASNGTKPTAPAAKAATPAGKAATPAKKAPEPKSESEEEDSEEDDEEDESEDESEDEPPVKVQKTAPQGVVANKQQGKPQQQQNKPQQQQQKQNPNTPQGKGGNQNAPKTPQTGNKPQQHQQNKNFSAQKSGDKRKDRN